MKFSWRPLAPTLAGATIRDRMVAGLGAMAGIALTAALTNAAAGMALDSPWIVAPIGASSVLVFAVPASPLAQPWSVVGGNVLSALVGLTLGARIGDPFLACGVSVGVAIMLMALLRCLHPPGGAAALLTALLTHKTGAPLSFAFWPIGLNSIFLVALGWVFHRFSGHSYPHRPPAPSVNVHETGEPPPHRRGFESRDLDEALTKIHESYDIDRDDLEYVLRSAEWISATRLIAPATCGDIMSRALLCVAQDMPISAAREIFRQRALRHAPVIDASGVAVGVLTPAGLARETGAVAECMSSALFATLETPALDLLPDLAEGRAHEAIVVDAGRRPLGMVTQTDLLAFAQRIIAHGEAPATKFNPG